jgi:hypothetical protein
VHVKLSFVLSDEERKKIEAMVRCTLFVFHSPLKGRHVFCAQDEKLHECCLKFLLAADGLYHLCWERYSEPI